MSLGNPASLNYASRVDLDATFTAATFATRWAYAVSPYLSVGFADQTSYGVRGGVTVAFGP